MGSPEAITEAGQHSETQRKIWVVFAKFGMGPNARSSGATLSGIVADFTTPVFDTDVSSVEVEATPNLAIPDNQPAGVTDVLTVTQQGQLVRLTASVNIEHTYIGDLLVRLLPPASTGVGSVAIHNRSGGGTENLKKTFDSLNVPGLSAFLNKKPQGAWTLEVQDKERQDTGKILSFSIELTL